MNDKHCNQIIDFVVGILYLALIFTVVHISLFGLFIWEGGVERCVIRDYFSSCEHTIENIFISVLIITISVYIHHKTKESFRKVMEKFVNDKKEFR